MLSAHAPTVFAAGMVYCTCRDTSTGACSNGVVNVTSAMSDGHQECAQGPCVGKETYRTTQDAEASVTSNLAACNAEPKPGTVQPTSPAPTPPTRETVQPNLEINIPGVVFTPAIQKDGKLTINWIAEYIAGIYKYLLGIAVTVAIVMIMIGGLQYVLSAGGGDVKKAKKRINDAIIGLILLFSVYLILFAVNGPRLTAFNALTLSQIPTISYPEEDEPDSVNGVVSTNVGDVSGPGIGGPGALKIPAELAPSLKLAAAEVSKKNYELFIASSFRSVADQERLIKANCQNPPGAATCNPKPGKAQTCILRGGKAESCPHTTGRALDIWGATRVNGVLQQCISQADCMKDKAACRANPCQAAVLTAMKSQGFCNLSSEPWHFEKPKMSSNCN